MKPIQSLEIFSSISGRAFALLLASSLSAIAAPPDLTAVGAIATVKADYTYSRSYNLGPTGLRGWIFIDRSASNIGADGLMTDPCRQILVSVVGSGTPAAGVLAVDDVILGVGWGAGTDPLPAFTSDARKSFGWAIGEAEKSENGGIMRLKRWRAGVTTDVSITLPVMGTYSTTAPYSCPKSSAVLAKARTYLVGQLLADQPILTDDFAGAVSGLALLGGVSPGDPNYAAVQTRLQTYARSLTSAGPNLPHLDVWGWGHIGMFLAEYYLSTGDTQALPGINSYALKLAQSQSMYGTFGHNPAMLRLDGSGKRSCIGYGPVNNAGLPANIALVMSKKALEAAGQTVNPEIVTSVQLGSDFFASYVNRGSIPYGEHSPGADNHASNGKDQMCAVLYGLQSGRATETEYFTRMSVAGFTGREYGHTGQGFSYLWGGLAANVGGALATSEYLKNVRWHLDLQRRSDGSFVYDGEEQYNAGVTSDGTYLGKSSYHDLSPTASYILTYALPLQRLHITGKNANPANTLDPTKVANAIAAATYSLDNKIFTIPRLIADLGEFDPVVRNYAAIELAKRSLSASDLTTLRGMITGADANGRMGACQTLGLLKDATALPLITQRLDKTIEPEPWVRAIAAKALRSYPSATMSAQRDPMLTALTANATSPTVINWTDPLQTGNGYLSLALFGNGVPDGSPGSDIQTYTVNAAKNLLYPAVRAGLKQPDSYPRTGAGSFLNNRLPLVDVQAMIADVYQVIRFECEVDRMWSSSPRASGINTLSKYKIKEAIPLGLEMLELIVASDNSGFFLGDDYRGGALNALAAYGDAARWTLPTLRGYLKTWNPTTGSYTTLVNTINTIEAAITAPVMVDGSAVANHQVVVTTGVRAITLTGSSPRTSVTFSNVTAPLHGTLVGTPPNLTYTPDFGYTGPDHFTFQTTDDQTTSLPGTVSIIVGTAGTGLKGEYFDNTNFTNLKRTRTDAQVNFDWGTTSPDPAVAADTFSVRWDGVLLVPETGTYTFSTLNSDGVRLYINGALVLDNYVDQTTSWKDGASLNLTAGQLVDVHMLYYENTGSAVAKLKWTGPSFAGANGSIIGSQWLFDGTGINRIPYAHSQSVTLLRNTPQPITLSGSGGALTYAIITPPTNGTLTGTAPNLTYTPAANFSGTDSFTFLVNNGSNSSPATVSIGVLGGQSATFTWNAAASGTLGTAANWVGNIAPDTTGQAFYNLNFAPAGTYTVTHDLNNDFQLNQLNLAGAITLSGANRIALVANGPTLAQLNQNSSSAVTIDTPLSLAAMTRLGGSGSGQVTAAGVISGSGGLIKDNPGTLSITGAMNNTYSGGTVLNNGRIYLYDGRNSTMLGTGAITVNGGLLHLDRFNPTNNIVVNGGSFRLDNGYGNTLSGAITNNSSLVVEAWFVNQTFSGVISGPGGITLTSVDGGRLVLSGANTYTGPNRVLSGTLTCSQAASLGTGSLDITTGAKVALNFTGTRAIAALTYNGGTALPPGTYGSTASPATNTNDTYFSGTGTITILPSSVTTLALTAGTSPAAPGAALTFGATVSGASPTGSVSFFDGTTLLGTSTVNASFQASFTTSTLPIGSRSITARYLGNAANWPSTSSALPVEIISIVPSTPTNLFAAPSNNQITVSWSISPGAASYYVKRSLTSGGPYVVIGNPASGNYIDSTAFNGTTYYYVVSAINSQGESANSNQASGIPNIQPSSTTLVSSPLATSPYGTSVTFTAALTVAGGPATGTVTFRNGATVLGAASLDTNGQATFTTSTLAVANYSITATYGGDSNFNGSVSTPYIFSVTPKPLTITGVTAANKNYDGTFAATLSGGTIASGIINGDTVSLVPGSGTFANRNVGTWAVTASGYTLAGVHAANYTLSAQPTVPNATINPLPVQLTGTKVYNATTLVNGTNLMVANKISGDDVTLSGSSSLVSKDVGNRALNSFVTPARVQSGTGFGNTTTTTSFTVTLGAAPSSGNTLVAVISTRGTLAARVTGVSSVGATWSRLVEGVNAAGSTTEIWSAPVGTGAAAAVTISTVAGRTAGVVTEYSGIATTNAVDQTANSSGATSTSPVTGTTAVTTQANELWIAGIGYRSSTPTLGSILNSFSSVASAASTNATAGNNAKVNALERIVSATGAASSGGTLSASAIWSGAVATLKAKMDFTLSLQGAAAANYTLTGLTGSVQITPKPLTLATTPVVTTKPYDGLTSAILTGATLRTAITPGTGTALDGAPHTGDAVALALSGTFDTKDAGASKPVTSTSTLSGANAGNYTLTQPAGLTGTIQTAGLTVTAGNQIKQYGQTLAFGSGATQFTSSGLISGDIINSVTMTCTGGVATAPVGAYPITPSAATGVAFNAGNYAINYVSGSLTISIASTTTSVSASSSPTVFGQPVTLTATVNPAPGNGTVQFYDNAVALGSPVPVSGAQAKLIISTLAMGSRSLTATFSGTTNHSSSTSSSLSLTVDTAPAIYQSWATTPAHGLTAGVNDGPTDDPDKDGTCNLIEFALGGAPMVSSQVNHPKLNETAGNWIFSYDRSHVSESNTIQVIEYSNNLASWTPLTIPSDSAGSVTITPGVSSDHVEVSIPPQGTNGYARLKVVIRP